MKEEDRNKAISNQKYYTVGSIILMIVRCIYATKLNNRNPGLIMRRIYIFIILILQGEMILITLIRQ